MMDWEKKQLRDVCEIGDGNYSSKYPKANDFIASGIPFITAKNLKYGTVVSKHIRYISEDQHSTLTKGHVKEGDLVIVVRGSSTGNCSLVPHEYKNSNLNSQLAYLRTENNILDSKFLYYIFSSPCIQKVVYETISGSAQPQLPNNKLLGIEISFPPINEQKRIVAKLDKCFEAIDKARANVKKNLQNAKDLFQSQLNQIFSQKGEGWASRKLGDELLLKIIDGDRGKNYPKKIDFLNEGYCVFMNTGNVRPDGFNFKSVVFITRERDNLLRKGKLNRNDVVLTTRGTIGNIGLYSSSIPFEHIRINSGMLIFRTNRQEILSEYLFEVFRSSFMKEQIKAKTSGAAQPQLPIKTLVNFIIHVPIDLEIQKKCVSKIKEIESQTQSLESNYKRELDALDELKKSILQKAFNGEL